MADLIEFGKIVNTHGIKGAVKLESWCDYPETLAELECIYFKVNGEFEERRIVSASVAAKCRFSPRLIPN